MRFNFSKISVAISTIGLVLIFLCEFFLVKELIKPHIEDHFGNYLFSVNLMRVITLILLVLNIILAFLAKHYQNRYNPLAIIFALVVFALFWLPWAQLYFENFTTYDIKFKHL